MTKPLSILFLKAPFEIIWGKPQEGCELPGSPFDGINVKGNDYYSTATRMLADFNLKYSDWEFVRFTVFNQELSLDQLLMLNWWEKYRPVASFGLKEHIDNPQINITTDSAQVLAGRCAQIIMVALGEATRDNCVLDSESVPYTGFSN